MSKTSCSTARPVYARCLEIAPGQLAHLASHSSVTSLIVDVPASTPAAGAARRIRTLTDRTRALGCEPEQDPIVRPAVLNLLARELRALAIDGAILLVGYVERVYGSEQREIVLVLNVCPRERAGLRVVCPGAGAASARPIVQRDRYLPITGRAIAGMASEVYDLMPPDDLRSYNRRDLAAE